MNLAEHLRLFSINTKINNLHYRIMCLVYQDYNSMFEARNLQALAIEMFQVKCGIAPMFMSEIFSLNKNLSTGNVSANICSLSYLGIKLMKFMSVIKLY